MGLVLMGGLQEKAHMHLFEAEVMLVYFSVKALFSSAHQLRRPLAPDGTSGG